MTPKVKAFCTIKLLALAFYFMLFNPAFSQTLQLENPLRFLALGDSYTIGQSVATNQRWPAQLRDSLMTRGISTDDLRYIATTGWRTDNLINAIKNQDLESQNYNLVSLLIGVNNQYQNRPFSQYVSEFPALVDSAIRYAGNDPSHVFIVSIPDYAFTPFGQQSGNPNQIIQQIDQYNAYNKEIADSLGITYFDITPISRLGLQHPEYVANDGLHPSAIQYTEWVKLMLEYIDSHSTSIDDKLQYQLEVSISPNPATEFFMVDLPGINNGNCRLEIYNLTGELVQQENISEDNSEVSTNDLKDGMYILKFLAGEKQAIRKLIIQR
jgi:lysophospholipase L1-like esterase